MCYTVSVDSPHNLHSGVSEVLCKLCLIEFVLKLIPVQLVSNLLSHFCCRVHCWDGLGAADGTKAIRRKDNKV